jgi:hypothetical protein
MTGEPNKPRHTETHAEFRNQPAALVFMHIPSVMVTYRDQQNRERRLQPGYDQFRSRLTHQGGGISVAATLPDKPAG